MIGPAKQCKFCSKSFSSENLCLHEARCQSLRQNIKARLSNRSCDQTPLKQSIGLQQDSLLFSSLTCTICNEPFTTFEVLKKHFQECSQLNQNIACEICQIEYPLFLIEYHTQECQELNHKSSSTSTSTSTKQQPNQKSTDQQIQQKLLDKPAIQTFNQNNNNNTIQINANSIQNPIFLKDSQIQQVQNYHEESYEDSEGDESDSHMIDEEGGIDADKLITEINITEEQINKILDNGGALPQLEDHDLSYTGGLNKQQLSQFPECRHELPQNRGLKKRILDEDRIKCSICMSKYRERQILLTVGCLHRFHKKCIISWLKKNTNCPICKIDQKEFFKKQNEQQKGKKQ